MSPTPQLDIGRELTERVTIHKNVGQEVIVTTDDKVRLCLMQARASLAAKHDLVAPAGVLVTLVTALATTDPRDFVLGRATWQAIYVIAAVLVAGWLARSGFAVLQQRGSDSVDSIIERLKASTPVVSEDALIIHSATYCAGTASLDVTAELAQCVRERRLPVLSGNQLAGDPSEGVPKELVVEYTYLGVHRTKRTPEGQYWSPE